MTAEPQGELPWWPIFEYAPAAMAVVSPDGVIAAANKRFRALAGPNRPIGADTRLWDVLAPAPGIAETAMEALSDAGMQQVRWRDSGLYETILSLAVARDGSRAGGAFICTLQDLGEERRQADNRLLDLLRAVRSDDAMHWFDRGGRILFANEQACALLGYSRDELLKMTVWDLNPWLAREDWERNWATTERQGSHVFETRHRHKDGREVAIEVTRATLRLADREIGLSFARDISARKEAETALRENMARLRMVIDNVPVVLLALDRDGVFTLSEGRALAPLGRGPGEVVGVSAFDLYKDEPAAQARIRRALKGETFSDEFDLDGRRMVGHYAPILDASGALQGSTGIMFDITERAEAERRLRETLTRLELVISNLPVVLFATDRRGVFRLSEGRALEAVGFTPGQAVGHSVFELFKDAPEVMERYRRVLAGETFTVPVQYGDRHFRGSYAPIRDPQNEVTGVAGMLWDVTETIAAEQALQKLNAELEDRVAQRTSELQTANDTLSETLAELRRTQQELVRSEKLAGLGSLVAGISHELSTPIGNCVVLASTLKERAAAVRREVAEGALKRSTLDDFVVAFREGVDILERNLARASQLLASFKQVSVDQASQQRRCFDLRVTLEEVVGTLSPMIGKARHRLQLELADNITMEGFPGPLSQVVINLVSNALVHAFDGTAGPGTMCLRAAAPEPGYARIVFSDDGVGIPAELLDRIFDPFVTTRRGRGGSGLGLHIVHNFVTNLLGGRIAVESKPGVGTTFTIEIPLVSPARNAGASSEAGASALPLAG